MCLECPVCLGFLAFREFLGCRGDLEYPVFRECREFRGFLVCLGYRACRGCLACRGGPCGR